MIGNVSRSMFINPKRHIYTTPLRDMCVKEIPQWVSEICSRNETRTDEWRAGRTADGHPRRRQYPPPQVRGWGIKNLVVSVYRLK